MVSECMSLWVYLIPSVSSVCRMSESLNSSYLFVGSSVKMRYLASVLQCAQPLVLYSALNLSAQMWHVRWLHGAIELWTTGEAHMKQTSASSSPLVSCLLRLGTSSAPFFAAFLAGPWLGMPPPPRSSGGTLGGIDCGGV